MLLAVLSTYATAGNVTGYVFEKTDKNQIALPGVNLFYSGTSIGTVTNNEGYFSLKVVPGRTFLSYSFVGFKKGFLILN